MIPSYLTKHFKIGNKSELAGDDDPGVVTLLTAASLRKSCTEAERQELLQMAKRLRDSKRKILEEQERELRAGDGSGNSPIRTFVGTRKTVDDYREYQLEVDLEAIDNRHPDNNSSNQSDIAALDRLQDDRRDSSLSSTRTETYFFDPSDCD